MRDLSGRPFSFSLVRGSLEVVGILEVVLFLDVRRLDAKIILPTRRLVGSEAVARASPVA